jgi:hypothetical protein
MFAETFKKQTTLADLVIFVFLVLYTFNQWNIFLTMTPLLCSIASY